jgi:hypothetical protein
VTRRDNPEHGKVNQIEKLELRDAVSGTLLASLTLHADGRKILDHDLTEYQVKGSRSGLRLYGSQGQEVVFQLWEDGVLLSWPDGRTCSLGFDKKPGQTCTDLSGVVDPKDQVRLEATPNGLGGRINAVITLNLRWVENRRL